MDLKNINNNKNVKIILIIIIIIMGIEIIFAGVLFIIKKRNQDENNIKNCQI